MHAERNDQPAEWSATSGRALSGQGPAGPVTGVGTKPEGEHGEGVAVADGDAVEMFVLQRAEEPLDHAVGQWAPHPCADVTEQRVVAGERVSEGHARKACPLSVTPAIAAGASPIT